MILVYCSVWMVFLMMLLLKSPSSNNQTFVFSSCTTLPSKRFRDHYSKCIAESFVVFEYLPIYLVYCNVHHDSYVVVLVDAVQEAKFHSVLCLGFWFCRRDRETEKCFSV